MLVSALAGWFMHFLYWVHISDGWKTYLAFSNQACVQSWAMGIYMPCYVKSRPGGTGSILLGPSNSIKISCLSHAASGVRFLYFPLSPKTQKQDICISVIQSIPLIFDLWIGIERAWVHFCFSFWIRYGSSKAMEGTTSYWILSDDGSGSEKGLFLFQMMWSNEQTLSLWIYTLLP